MLADLSRRTAELLAERAGETAMRGITGRQCEREDAVGTIGQPTRRLGQAAAAKVPDQRCAGSRLEQARKMEGRHADRRGDVRQRDVFGEVALDVPQCPACRVHAVAIDRCPNRSGA